MIVRGLAMDKRLAMDPPVSEAQRRAMYAAAAGNSTLGIPKSVGEEFVGKDHADKPIAAGIVFVAPDGDVLLLRRSDAEENYKGHWALPGGKADEGETAEDAAAREAKEEIGIDLGEGPLKPIHRKVTPNGMLYSTFANPVETKFVPNLNDEHSGYAWCSLDRLPEPMHPSVKSVLSDHIGVTADMTPGDWKGLREGFAKWTREEEKEPVHAADEKISFDLASVRSYSPEGHLHVSRTPISKANICDYYGHEIPEFEKLGLEPDRKYRLLRDPDELKKAADSSNGKQLLIKHVPVNVDDHRPDLTVGAVGTDAEFKDPYLYNSLTVHAREGIDGIEDESRKELSPAYRYDADMTPGKFRGEPYDGVMRNISFNHVCLVPEGRTGHDVVVGDQKPTGEMNMTKRVLTRKAALVGGAVMAYLQPKLAADSKIDLSAILADVTAKNFGSKKAKIAADIKAKAKLAKDATLDDLNLLLDKIEPMEVEEGADTDPNSGLPMTEAEMDAKAKDKAKDAEPSKLIAKIKEMLGDKLSAEEQAELDEMVGEETAEDETPEEKEVREKKEREDKAAKDAEGEEPKVTKAAMDSAIASSRKQATADALKIANDIREAERAVRPYVGDLALTFDSAEGVYRKALVMLGQDEKKVKGLPLDALQIVLSTVPNPNARKLTVVAQDSSKASDYAARFPAAGRIAL